MEKSEGGGAGKGNGRAGATLSTPVTSLTAVPPPNNNSNAAQPPQPGGAKADAPPVASGSPGTQPGAIDEGVWSPPDTAMSKMQETFLEMLYGGWVDRRRVINLLRDWRALMRILGRDITHGFYDFVAMKAKLDTQELLDGPEVDPKEESAWAGFAGGWLEELSEETGLYSRVSTVGGRTLVYCSQRFASTFMTTQDFKEHLETYRTWGPHVWGSMVAPDDLPQFYQALMEGVLAVLRKESSAVVGMMSKTGEFIRSYVRFRASYAAAGGSLLMHVVPFNLGGPQALTIPSSHMKKDYLEITGPRASTTLSGDRAKGLPSIFKATFPPPSSELPAFTGWSDRGSGGAKAVADGGGTPGNSTGGGRAMGAAPARKPSSQDWSAPQQGLDAKDEAAPAPSPSTGGRVSYWSYPIVPQAQQHPSPSWTAQPGVSAPPKDGGGGGGGPGARAGYGNPSPTGAPQDPYNMPGRSGSSGGGGVGGTAVGPQPDGDVWGPAPGGAWRGGLPAQTAYQFPAQFFAQGGGGLAGQQGVATNGSLDQGGAGPPPQMMGSDLDQLQLQIRRYQQRMQQPPPPSMLMPGGGQPMPQQPPPSMPPPDTMPPQYYGYGQPAYQQFYAQQQQQQQPQASMYAPPSQYPPAPPSNAMYLQPPQPQPAQPPPPTQSMAGGDPRNADLWRWQQYQIQQQQQQYMQQQPPHQQQQQDAEFRQWQQYQAMLQQTQQNSNPSS